MILAQCGTLSKVLLEGLLPEKSESRTITHYGTTLTIRLQLNPDFDQGFSRSEFLILTNMHMHKKFGARKSSIEIGVELQSYR